RVHEIQALAGLRRFGRLQNVDELAVAADLFEVAERLFLDGGKAALDVAPRRLAFRQVVDLVGLDHIVLIGLPHLVPALADLRIDRALLADVLPAGDLRGFAETPIDAFGDQLVVHVADGRAGAEARGRVALAAFGRDPKLGNVARLALQFA